MSRAFTPRRVAGLKASVEAMASELLDDLAASGGGLIDRLAFPLAANLIYAAGCWPPPNGTRPR